MSLQFITVARHDLHMYDLAITQTNNTEVHKLYTGAAQC